MSKMEEVGQPVPWSLRKFVMRTARRRACQDENEEALDRVGDERVGGLEESWCHRGGVEELRGCRPGCNRQAQGVVVAENREADVGKPVCVGEGDSGRRRGVDDVEREVGGFDAGAVEDLDKAKPQVNAARVVQAGSERDRVGVEAEFQGSREKRRWRPTDEDRENVVLVRLKSVR